MSAPTAAAQLRPDVLEIPALSLVVLVGVSGSGKSTFARRHFAPTQVMSSDAFRGLVADDENDQSATPAAFDALHHVAGLRLAAGRLTVVDATNVQEAARAELVALARRHHVLPVAVVLDVPVEECVRRNAARPDRSFGAAVVRRQQGQLRRSLGRLDREGFRVVHVLRGVDAVDAATVRITPMRTDLRHLHGPFDVVGDVHGCRSELEALLARLGYAVRRDGVGRAVGAVPPPGRTAVFLGDLVDRGPDSPGVLRLVMGMVAAGEALCVPGNHEVKLVRALRGRSVTVSHGLAETLEQLDGEEPEFVQEVQRFADGLVSHLVLDGGRLVVAHAGLAEAYQGRASGRVRAFALYGDTTGETDEYGLPVRYPWARDYRGRATVLYGHTPTPEPEWVNNTLCLDTGCVFGGRLTALRYPERELVSVPAEREWYAPARPLGAPAAASDASPANPGRRPPEDPDAATGPENRQARGASAGQHDELELRDVLPGLDGGHGSGGAAATRVVETAHHGRVGVRAANAAAALEVMSRFALDPRVLLHLPPTMAPGPTSRLPGTLEHPLETFEAYRADGVDAVVCQEKHMGSRAVVLLCRSRAFARERFGAAAEPAGGAVWTRTGRSFLDGDLTAALLERLRGAAESCDLWGAAGADGWVLLDAELMPWSAKASELLRTQYAAVGAAARAVLPDAVAVLEQAVARGLDVGDVLARTRRRADAAQAFTQAYRRYCWPTEGLAGLRLAPFQLLAAGGPTERNEARTYHDRPHAWHLDLADALVGALGDPAGDGPGLGAHTRRIAVHTGDRASIEAAVDWWEELTGAGGEGMVVKPAANLVRGARGLVQPAVKVRGREYLRIVYGPDYDAPGNLDRLRQRSLGHKRSMALREYALGVEALERLARGEPLWRVHECVFAVLACESEPVDPRL